MRRARMTAKPKPAPQSRKVGPMQLLLMQQLWPRAVEPELVFHPTRKWQIDVAVLDHKIAVEIDGGVWVQGRHTRGAGVEKDNEKYAALAEYGWRLIRVTPRQVQTGQALKWVEAAMITEVRA